MNLRVMGFALLLASAPVFAEQTQSLSAQVGVIAFQSGDEEIVLVPIDASFSLTASTLGAAAWPPPKTRIDRLSITCDGFKPGQTLVLDDKAFQRSTCDVSFKKGDKPMGEEPDAEYRLDKDSSDNRFEITQAHDKVYEGVFQFDLKDANGASIKLRNGRFVIEDRQL